MGFSGFFPLIRHEYNKLYIINYKGLVIQVIKSIYPCILNPNKKKWYFICLSLRVSYSRAVMSSDFMW